MTVRDRGCVREQVNMRKTGCEWHKNELPGVSIELRCVPYGVKVKRSVWGMVLMLCAVSLASCSKHILVPDIKPETLLSKKLFYNNIRAVEILRDSSRVVYRLKLK